MTKLIRLTGGALIAVLALALPAAAQTETPTAITIIHVNDTHSHVDSFGPRDDKLEGTLGGLERAAGLIAQLKATEPNPLFVHAGDAFHGDFMFNALFDVPELAILKQIGLDAMAVGNHEFDLTPAALVGALIEVGKATGDSGFPLVSANLDYSKCANNPCAYLPGWVRPSIVKNAGGVSVGIVGLTVWDDLTTQPKPLVIEGKATAIAHAQAQVNALREQGVQVIVLLSHLGRSKDADVIKQMTGVDVVIGGHDHRVDTAPVMLDAADGRKVPVVCAGDNYRYVGRLRLTYTPDQGVTVNSWTLLPVDQNVPPVPQIAAQVDFFKAYAEQKCPGAGDMYHEVVAQAAFEIPKRYDAAKQKRDTAMGNLITDAFRRYTGTEIAFTVTGLVSEQLYPGPLLGADIFRPVSYGYDGATCLGFTMATFEITGAELLRMLNLSAAATKGSDTLDLQLSGVRYKYDSSRTPLTQVLEDSVHVNGQPLELQRTYTVTTNAGIAGLLPTLPTPIAISNVKLLPEFEYRVLRDYVHALGTVEYTSESRIRDVSVVSPD